MVSASAAPSSRGRPKCPGAALLAERHARSMMILPLLYTEILTVTRSALPIRLVRPPFGLSLLFYTCEPSGPGSHFGGKRLETRLMYLFLDHVLMKGLRITFLPEKKQLCTYSTSELRNKAGYIVQGENKRVKVSSTYISVRRFETSK